MSYYTQDWIDEATDPMGNACRCRFILRDKTNILRDLFAIDCWAKAVNPIKRETERGTGIMQGQNWDIELWRSDALTIKGNLDGQWCQLRGVMGTEDEPLISGRIRNFRRKSDGTIHLTVEDSIVALVNARFKGDFGFDSSGHVGLMYTVDAEEEYDNDYDVDGVDEGVTRYSGNESYLNDETFTVTFTSTTAFAVTDSAGNSITTGTTSTDCDVWNNGESSNPVATIEQEGWTGTYATDDVFEFHTTAIRATTNLSPTKLIETLIKDVADLTVKNVTTGVDYTSPLYDAAGVWTDAYTDTSSEYWGGVFYKGGNIVDAIQGVLRVHAWALFACPDGRIALHHPQPDVGSSLALRGDWHPDINIMESELNENMVGVANVVRMTYLNDSDEDIQIELRDADTDYDDEMLLEFDIPWRVPFTVMRTAVSQNLARHKKARVTYRATTPFTAAAILPGDRVDLHDPEAGIESVAVTVSKVTVDPISDVAELQGFVDPLAGEGHAIVGDSGTTPVGTRIGGSGDAGSGTVW